MSFYYKKQLNWSRIANSLSITRILIGLPLILVLTSKMYEISILLIILGGITDYLDGFLARKFNSQSNLGAKLDPLADKILLLGPILWIAHEDLVPIWSIWILISRELMITGWRSNSSSGGPASIYGKYKTLLQFTSVILLIWPQNWSTSSNILIISKLGYIIYWISLLLALISGIKYVINQRDIHPC